MRNLAWKLRVLANFIGDAVRSWREEVWVHDPDSPACCSGNPGPPDFCGCMGVTRREVYSPQKPRPISRRDKGWLRL